MEDNAGRSGVSQKREAETREHLANERTLLSWVRTGVGLISIGLVVERAGVLVGGGPGGAGSGVSAIFGLALAVLGVITLAVGTAQFFRNRRRIVRGDFTPAVAAYMVVVAGSAILAASFILYVLFS